MSVCINLQFQVIVGKKTFSPFFQCWPLDHLKEDRTSPRQFKIGSEGGSFSLGRHMACAIQARGCMNVVDY